MSFFQVTVLLFNHTHTFALTSVLSYFLKTDYHSKTAIFDVSISLLPFTSTFPPSFPGYLVLFPCVYFPRQSSLFSKCKQLKDNCFNTMIAKPTCRKFQAMSWALLPSPLTQLWISLITKIFANNSPCPTQLWMDETIYKTRRDTWKDVALG